MQAYVERYADAHENKDYPDLAEMAKQALQLLDDVVRDPPLEKIQCDVLPDIIGLLTQIENFPHAVDSAVAVQAFQLMKRLNLPRKCKLKRTTRDLVMVACCRQIEPMDREAVMNSLAASFGEPLADVDIMTLMIARTRLFGKIDPMDPRAKHMSRRVRKQRRNEEGKSMVGNEVAGVSACEMDPADGWEFADSPKFVKAWTRIMKKILLIWVHHQTHEQAKENRKGYEPQSAKLLQL